jgi:hypothetical protein
MFDVNYYVMLASSDMVNSQYSINLLTVLKSSITLPEGLFRCLWVKNDNGLSVSLNNSNYMNVPNYNIVDIIDNNSNMNQLVYTDTNGNQRLILL